MNVGKVFENQFKKSVPEDILAYKIPDPANSFKKSALRFSIKPPFDFIVFDSHYLFCLELKSVSGKSISFERTENDKGEIHLSQIESLREWNKYKGTVCGIVIEFRELEKTIFLDIDDFDKLGNLISKKSFSYKDLETYDICHIVIGQQKLRKNYTYDVGTFIERVRNERKQNEQQEKKD